MDRITEIDLKSQVCQDYRVTEKDGKLRFDLLGEEKPLKDCPNVFGFNAKAIPKVLDWSEDAIKYAKEHK